MCQFCHQHGEGKKWYLKAEHYSQDLLSDLRRRNFIKDFIMDVGNGQVEQLEEKLQFGMKAPSWLRQIYYGFTEKRYRRDHYGQVVPLEDLDEVLDLANSIVRIPCICRKNSTGRNDDRYCLALSIDPEKVLDIKETFLETFRPGPDVGFFEHLSKAETLELLQAFEKESLIHSLWTFKTPFIGGLCNCDRADCLALLADRYGLRLFFRAEYVAQTAGENCSGCRSCLSSCQFGAIGFSAARQTAFIDPLRCYGCGVCRSHCDQDAIHLIPRNQHPIARRFW
jgi:ferredoxin